jgi:uncharacterized damage-inducible protein DinB
MINFHDLFQYVKKEREALIDALEHLTHNEFTEDVGLSFGSIKNVFAHTVMVEDIWLHYRIAGLEASPPHIPEDFTTLNEIKNYIDDVDTKTQFFLDSLTDDVLQRDLRVSRPSGRSSVDKIINILYHIPIEIIHHYGEIFAELWKMNVIAPYYSYLDYTREQRSSAS